MIRLIPILFLSLSLFSSIVFAKIEVHGHRGARAIYPENSLPAFQYALEQAVDVLELDLVVTKDNVLIISHDPLVNTKLCNADKLKLPQNVDRTNIPFRSLTYKQVQEIQCGLKPHPQFSSQKLLGVKIPSLEELLIWLNKSKLKKAKTVKLNVETKMNPRFSFLTPSPKGFASLVVDLVHKYNFTDRIIVQSFDARSLVEVKKINPKIKTAFLNYASTANFVPLLKEIKADIYSPNMDWITKEQVQLLHSAGILVVPWTANKQEDWEYLVSLAVDGIISDDPKALREFLNKKNLP